MQICLYKKYPSKKLYFFIFYSLLLLVLFSCAQLPPDTKQNNLISVRIVERSKFDKNFKLEVLQYKESRTLENSLNGIFQEMDSSRKLEMINPWLQVNNQQKLSPNQQPHIWILLNLLSADAHNKLRADGNPNQLDGIIKHYENALQVISHIGYPLQTAAIQNNLAKALIDLPDDRRINYLEKAINLAQQALKVRTRREFPEEWTKTQIILAKAFHKRNIGDKTSNLKQSVELFEQALEAQTREKLPDDFLVMVYELSQVLLELEQYPKALAYIEKALKENEFQLQQNSSHETDQFLANQAESLFSSAIWAASQMQDYEKAIRLMEWGKGRIFRKKLDSDNSISFQNKNFKLKAPPDIFTIYQWLSSLPADSTIIAPIFSNQGSIVFILPAGTKNINEANIIKIKEFTRKDLHALIRGEKSDEWGGHIAAYVNLKIKKQPKKWETHVNQALTAFSHGWLDRTLDRLQQLGIRRDSRLIWLLDSDSGLLPIHSVTYQNLPLLAHYIIHFSPSIYSAFISHNNLARNRNSHFLAVINPYINPKKNLPGAETEYNLIKQYFGSITELIRKDASLENYEREIKKFSPAYIHFASHGIYEWKNPLDSGLVLSDQRLTINYLFEMPASYLDGNRLVVLSACETSLVDINMPSESIGIPLAFLRAGAPGVISTLWEVEDSATAVLMAKFYQLHVKDSLEPSQALRKAQLWLRSANKKEIAKLTKEYYVTLDLSGKGDLPFKDRYYWAGFVYSGM